MHSRLKTRPKTRQTFTSKTKNSYSDLGAGFIDFAAELSTQMSKRISEEVDLKFKQIEPTLFETIDKTLSEVGKRIQKSIDNLVQENIFKLQLISKRTLSASSRQLIKSGSKKRTKRKGKNKKKQSISLSKQPVFDTVESLKNTKQLNSTNSDFMPSTVSQLKSPQDDSIFDKAHLYSTTSPRYAKSGTIDQTQGKSACCLSK